MNTSATIADRLLEAMRYRDMSAAELCRITGISTASMSQYVQGHFKPKQNRIMLMARALGVSDYWLMGYDYPMERGKEDAPERCSLLIRAAEKLDEDELGMLEDMAKFFLKKKGIIP